VRVMAETGSVLDSSTERGGTVGDCEIVRWAVSAGHSLDASFAYRSSTELLAKTPALGLGD